jgi:molybdenum cofactor cytidylyltransferase
MARENENANAQGSRDLNLTFMAFKRAEASSAGWPPDKNAIPGTAAVESSRMGTDKATLTFRGQTFLERIAQTLRQGGLERVTVVLGHQAEDIQRQVKIETAQVVINLDYKSGQTSSLQAGLRSLLPDDPEAIVLCLVDHPAISAETVRRIVATFRQSGAPVVIPTYQGRRGHPVLIARQVFEDLLELATDAGADSVVRKYRPNTLLVDVADEGIVVDVDDPESYARLTSNK